MLYVSRKKVNNMKNYVKSSMSKNSGKSKKQFIIKMEN